MILEMNNIKKSFAELGVLKDISISVDKGEVVSIIGPSGSGKSTLLRCATFLETIDSGEIKYMALTSTFSGEVFAPQPEAVMRITAASSIDTVPVIFFICDPFCSGTGNIMGTYYIHPYWII